jgi:hypothetical protein
MFHSPLNDFVLAWATAFLRFRIAMSWGGLSTGFRPRLNAHRHGAPDRAHPLRRAQRPALAPRGLSPSRSDDLGARQLRTAYGGLPDPLPGLGQRRRPPAARSLGSFETWSQTLGGILHVAGVPGFLGNLDDVMEASDSEGGSWRAFIQL